MSFSRLDEIQNKAKQIVNEVWKEILEIHHAKDTQIREEERDLVNNLERISLNVFQLQNSIPNLTPVNLSDGDSAAIPLLEAVYLNIEHEYNEEKQPRYLDLNHKLQKEILLDRLKSDKNNLKILSEEYCDSLNDIQKKIENLEQGIIEDKKCIDFLRKKKSELTNQRNDKQVGLQLKLQNELKRLKTQYRDCLEKLRDFLADYYPSPNELRRSPSRRTGGSPVKTMADTLQLLLRKTVQFPHDPWIEVESTFYEEYINVLKEVRVIVKHPNNKDLISLNL